MYNRLLLAPIAAFALACGSDGPSASVVPSGGTPTPGGTGASGDTTVSAVGFVSSSVVESGTTYRYKVFVPANYNASKAKIPVIVFLHGSGESGSDNEAQVNIGLGPFVKDSAATFLEIVVFPQSPRGENVWPNFVRLVPVALDQVMAQYGKADPKRVYLTGWSFGMVHGFNVAYKQPTRFAAFVPMSGFVCGFCITGSRATTPVEGAQIAAQALKSLPIWHFQGSVDDTVLLSDVLPQVAVFKSIFTNYRYTEVPDGTHQIYGSVYSNPAMWAWLWAQSR